MLDEVAFQRVIALERRRTERSRKPFMLMLVDGYEQSLLKGFDYGRLLEALAVSIRETDVVGWYRTGHVFGVIFTEINIDDRGAMIDSMTSRIDDVLHIHLGLEKLKGLQISFHVFPEDWHKGANGNSSNPTLYPDLSKRTTDKRINTLLKRV